MTSSTDCYSEQRATLLTSASRSHGRTVKKTTPTDYLVGARVREPRRAIGMSQTDPAKAIRAIFQHAQKYENGTNRVGAGRLSGRYQGAWRNAGSGCPVRLSAGRLLEPKALACLVREGS